MIIPAQFNLSYTHIHIYIYILEQSGFMHFHEPYLWMNLFWRHCPAASSTHHRNTIPLCFHCCSLSKNTIFSTKESGETETLVWPPSIKFSELIEISCFPLVIGGSISFDWRVVLSFSCSDMLHCAWTANCKVVSCAKRNNRNIAVTTHSEL